MRRLASLIGVSSVAMTLGGCPATIDKLLNLSPQQQANLQLWVQAGKTVVQASATLFCEYEPSTTKLIQIFDASSNTAKQAAKVDAAQAILCNQALASGAVVKG